MEKYRDSSFEVEDKQAKKGGIGHSIWHSIFKCIDEYKIGTKKFALVGDGNLTFFLHDKWFGDDILSKQFPIVYEISRSKQAKISEFLDWINF